jgi:hypothetical protein
LTRREVKIGAVQFGDPGDDRQAEPAARWLLSPVQAMETAQDRIPVIGLSEVSCGRGDGPLVVGDPCRFSVQACCLYLQLWTVWSRMTLYG